MFNLSTSDFKLAKSSFLGKLDVSISILFFKSVFVSQLDKSNSTSTFASKEFGFGKYSLSYNMFFLSTHILKELLYLFYLTYNVSPFLSITFVNFFFSSFS